MNSWMINGLIKINNDVCVCVCVCVCVWIHMSIFYFMIGKMSLVQKSTMSSIICNMIPIVFLSSLSHGYTEKIDNFNVEYEFTF
jgi:hypothetical protein